MTFFLIGNQEVIDDSIVQMRKHGLVLKTEDDLKDYLSIFRNQAVKRQEEGIVRTTTSYYKFGQYAWEES